MNHLARNRARADVNCSGCQAVLYCTVLYCTVLYCTVLYCIVLKQSEKIRLNLRDCMDKDLAKNTIGLMCRLIVFSTPQTDKSQL